MLSDVILRPLTVDDETAALAAHAELAGDDFGFLLERVDGERWAGYVERLDGFSRGIGVPPGRVPATYLVADIDGEIAGRTSIRHELNEWLQRYGGHIGYGVRPHFRRRGVATEILRQSLTVARDLGIERSLLTCGVDNTGSATVIERCGGVLEGTAYVPEEDVTIRRYWVPTT